MIRRCRSRFSAALLSWLCLATSCLAGWDVTPLGEGYAQVIQVDSLGAPHLGVSTGGQLHYQTLVDGSFATQETFPSTTTFALDNVDKPFFVAKTGPDFSPELIYRDDQGIQQAIPIANHRVGTIQLIGFDSQNRPHVGYNDPDTEELIHSRWDGVSWTPRVVATGSNFRFANSWFTATIDANDRAHFLWDDDSDQLQYAEPTAMGWTIDPLFMDQDVFPYNMQIDQQGDIHFAHHVFTGSLLTGGLFYGVIEDGAPRNERIPVAKNFGASRAMIVLDDDQLPNIFSYDAAFRAPVDLVHYQLTKDGWESTIIDTHPDPQFSGPDQIVAAYGGGRHHVLFSTGDRDIFYAVQTIPEPTAGCLLSVATAMAVHARRRRAARR